MTPLFSISVIGRNEAKTLPAKLLRSLVEFRDRGGEVVYVDTGSQDESARVARDWGCRVDEVGDEFVVPTDMPLDECINRKFLAQDDHPIPILGKRIFDFASARNYADSLCHNDVVLVAGCDESFTRLDIDALNALVASGHDRMDIHYVHAHDQAGRPAIQFRRGVFYSRRKCRWKGVVHEVIIGECPIFHPPPEAITCEHQQEPNDNRTSYLPGLALDCYQNPENDRNSHYFARELHYSGRHRSAIREFVRHRDMPHAWKAEQAQSLLFIGDCWKCLGDTAKAKSAWWQAFEEDGTRREPLMRLAMHHYRKADHAKAAAYASASLHIPDQGFYFNLAENYRHLPHEILYVSLWWIGQKEESRRHWEKALQFAPENAKYVADAVFYR